MIVCLESEDFLHHFVLGSGVKRFQAEEIFYPVIEHFHDALLEVSDPTGGNYNGPPRQQSHLEPYLPNEPDPEKFACRITE